MTGIAGGGAFSLAMKSDGTAWGWGGNVYGQLGDASTTDRLTAVQVQTAMGQMSSALSLSGGHWHSLAARSDGLAWAWGYNLYGQLGDNATTNHSVGVWTD